MRLFFITAVGLLPLWVAIGIVVFFLIRSGSESLVVTPWAIGFAIPACAVTLLVTFLALKVTTSIEIDLWQMFVCAVTTAVAALAMLALIIWLYQSRQESRENYIKQESAAAESFLRENKAVQRASGHIDGISRIFVTLPSPGSGWLPLRYDFSIQGTKPVRVGVIIYRSGTAPVFVLTDLTPLPQKAP
ncbi:MAG: hypothetical protein CFE43_15325 [Burkholderiales bacterium PBB3]|nr:MAG: hypothetical protein CFE43_15325 [Burkholderiales bacterium PBB3]